MTLLRTSCLAMISVLSLFLAGCSSGGKLGGVEVSLVTFKAPQPALLETQVVMTLRYTNTNVVPIAFSGTRHKVYLNGTYIGQAVSDQPLGLPQLNTQTQDTTLVINNLSMLNTLRSMTDKPQAGYRLESTLYMTSGEERSDIRTRSEGSVDLSGLRLPTTAAP